jgi:hypothetical protein
VYRLAAINGALGLLCSGEGKLASVQSLVVNGMQSCAISLVRNPDTRTVIPLE